MKILRPDEIALLALGRPVVPANGGGDSSSSSSSSTSTTTNTQNIDKRQVVDAGSVGVSSDQSTVNVQVLDNGAIRDALAFASRAGDAASGGYSELLKVTSAIFNQAFAVIDKNAALAKELTSEVGTAYDVAQSSVSGARDQQKTLLIVGGIIVGLVAMKGIK